MNRDDTSPLALKRQLMVVVRDLPTSQASGSGQYRISLISYLARHFEVFVLVLGYRGSTLPQAVPLEFAAASVIHRHEPKGGFSVWSSPANADETLFVESWTARVRPDLLIVDRVWLAPVITRAVRLACGISSVLTHNVQYQRLLAFEPFGVNPNNKDGDEPAPRWTRQMEASALSRADVILAISKRDQQAFSKITPFSLVDYLPFACGTVSHHETSDEVPGTCLFVGSSSPANEISIQWFLNEVWPLVGAVEPSVSLRVVGGIGQRLAGSPAGRGERVVIQGRVEDLSAEYARSQIFVVPLLAGSGLKIKLIEAICHGKAGVSTSVGLQGVDELVHQGVMRADSAADFAGAILRLLKDHRLRQAYAARNAAFARQHFTAEHVYGGFVSRMTRLLHPRPDSSAEGSLELAAQALNSIQNRES